ncbi:hypothetical protein BG011_002267 [Mortierella polycephala]|uniref:Vacuolar ATPase assembly protein VMA22 n=1 Tax=Mortierella polycephala TaxID=41804 RepID=A0A9P6QF36_9FUNG|nr:hypothetical protein BG011_002267 [Mortierella polycephala]
MPDVNIQLKDNIRHELDDLILQYMSLVDEHLAAFNRVSDQFQQGRELISQAKYIMGPKNVSADCYDHRMKALRGVTINGSTDIEIRDLLTERQRLAKAEQESNQGQEQRQGQDQKSEFNDHDQVQNHSGLRRRGVAAKGLESTRTADTLVEDDQKEMIGSKETVSSTTTTGSATLDTMGSSDISAAAVATAKKKKKERNPDPLLWFGVFVPASLRNAQSIFQKSLQDVVEMTAIRQRLFELEEKIIALEQAKDSSTASSHQQPILDSTTLKLDAAK